MTNTFRRLNTMTAIERINLLNLVRSGYSVIEEQFGINFFINVWEGQQGVDFLAYFMSNNTNHSNVLIAIENNTIIVH